MNLSPYYILILTREFERRKESNSRYSLRAYARFLDILPSSLSRILANKTELTVTTAIKIIKRLNLNSDERLMFIASFAEEAQAKALKLLLDEFDHEPEGNEKTLNPPILPYQDPIFVVDKNGRCLFTNEAGSRMHGLTSAQIIGKTMYDVGTPAHIADKIYKTVNDVFKNNGPITLIDSFPAPDRMRWYERKYLPMLGKNGQVQAVACHLKDITETKYLECKLKLITKSIEIISSSKEYESNLLLIGDLLLQFIADGCVIRFVYEKNKVIYSNHANPEKKIILQDLTEKYPFDESFPYAYHVALKGEVVIARKIDDELLKKISRSKEHEELLKKLEVGTFVSVPIVFQNKIFGSISIFRNKGKHLFRRDDVQLISTLASKMAFLIAKC